MNESYYDILKIKDDADLKEIKKAYRELAKKYHPDINKNTTAKFRQINEAYLILSDEKKRTAYDSILRREKLSELVEKYTQDLNTALNDLKDSTSNITEEEYDDSFLKDPIYCTLNNYKYYSIKEIYTALKNSYVTTLFFNLILYIFALISAPILRLFMNNLTLLDCSIYVAQLKILFYIRSYFYIISCILILSLMILYKCILGYGIIILLYYIFNYFGVF